MHIVWRCWMEGYSHEGTLRKINEWVLSGGAGAGVEPFRSLDVVKDDRKRIQTLISESDAELRAEHVNSLRYIKQRAFEEIDKTAAPMAVPGLLNVAAKAEETMAKIDGTLITRVEQQVSVTKEDEARVLVQVLVDRLGSEDEALRVLDDVRLKLNPPKVIDVEAREVSESTDH